MPRKSLANTVAPPRKLTGHAALGPVQPPAAAQTKRQPRARPQPGVSRTVRTHGILPSLVGYHLRLAQIDVFRDFGAALGEFRASPGRFGLLVLIRANPGLSQSRLAEAIGLDRSSLVPALNKLERERLVERRPAPDDGRANGIWLTQRGSELLDRMQQRVRSHETRLLRGFSAAEKAQLIELLQRIRENLLESNSEQ